MLLCTCSHCGDTFSLTVNAKVCHCGAITGALTSSDGYYVSGSHTILSLPNDLKSLPAGSEVLGYIRDKSDNYFKPKSHSLVRT